ncbi:hypothetical protein B2J86_10610 [Acidovorax sp. SRB_14]|uniref:FAD-dependent oxidoreductase n=1 Tax=Acidovorax sp. SRB_14 TaxID=1962699 RepID=UPI00156493DF|nr:FAD-dependent oxidoreductase [Acidovorax sp. SRB_14]NMM81366.1 hypothetical protein [Acidovorax sp. SRB_14]
MNNDINATLPAVVDLIVLGGGLAGHSAALEAAAAGKSVLLLEKTGQYGGSTVLSSGSFAFADTAAQREKGIQDTDELLRADIVKASGGRVVPALADLYVQEQRDAYEWLRQHGVEFHPIALSSNQGVPRTHPTDPWQLMRALHARVRASRNIQYVDNLSASELVIDASGSITGVVAGDGHQVAARLGVVLATGGFSRDRELIDKFCPRLANALVLGGEGNTGDGLKMAWKLGADLLDMPFITGTFGVSLNNYPRTEIDPGQEARLTLSIYKGGIAVNKYAERFADESISYKVLGEICLTQPDGVGFQIWDQKIMDQSAPQPTSNDLEDAYRKGLVHKADDIASLAKLVGLDPERLQQTVARYNNDVAEGPDTAFGRTGLGRGWGKLVAIDTAPFYIYPCSTGVVATYCGLKVDADMRVIDVRGTAIPHLYAAGEIVGGFHGSGYMSGSSLSKSVIFGRAAARTALETA